MEALDQRLYDLEQKLKYHDWYYMYRNDPNLWRAGTSKIAWIQNEIKYLNSVGLEPQVQALWERFCPWSRSNHLRKINDIC